ncbi:MAG TPA: PASTA domain-containing protein, partial [Gemmatimonadaceae bacterium]
LDLGELASSVHAPRPDTTAAGRVAERVHAAEERKTDSSAVADSLRDAARTVPADSDPRTGEYYVVTLPSTTRAVPPVVSPRAVPDVAGLPLRLAVRELHSAGFRVELIPGAPPTVVPAAGTMLEPGRVVKLGMPQ